MAGQQFQYDDSGNTFFYFLTSFVGLIVIPATYYLWPRDQNAEQIRLKNIRKVYGRCMWYRLRLLKPQPNIIPTVKKIVLLAGWALFLFLVYKVSKTDREYQEYNPYEVLNLDPVLLVYGLAFMVILPVVVGSWWYRSIRYSGDQILIRTTQIYTYFVYKTRNMDMKRLIMVLAGASEFDPQYNKDATSRPTDNILIPQVFDCFADQQFMLKKCPALLQEMVNVICQLIIMARSREEREFRAPTLASLENCMKLSQMAVQGLQQFKSPLLQLPHIEEDNLRRVSNHKKYKIKTIQDLVSLKESDRHSLLHFLEDEKYDEVMAVLGSFPYVTMDIKSQVLDDEDSNNITVGSLVTVLVKLTRQTMAEVFEKEQSICAAEEQPAEDGGDTTKNRTKGGWQQKSKGPKKAAKSKKKKPLKKKPTPVPLSQSKQPKQKQANGVIGSDTAIKEDEEEVSDKGSDSEEEETNRDSQSEKDDGSDRESDREQDEKQNKDDEAEWQELQQSIQRKERALLETKSKITHPVYSLYFPEEKQEWWWLYIADRKEQTLISMPYHVCTLKDTEEVELKFPAPGKPGNYQYTVFLRSDSYMGLDQIKPLKLEVHEAKPVPENHPQWDTAIEGDEDQEDSEGFEDSFEEEEEEEEDDD
ncbi:Translocation protein SEC63 like protein [Tupaia chinensis]|uniref:Translocation protein SEC63 like protein n=1 Tax=Tupaia chinensis TaxID=246437 RepID=L9JIB8_TUPCH|nr:Translocation protein SEC63 like protein [Tupaia chinensis]